ncbi:MAG: monothiol glutaredoxin, Grx4 family, partial [Gammaproteobacteria bacterium]|nr:monothiol glutaredoxin, Grx4 family [Gammaproteobacteria bacterium]
MDVLERIDKIVKENPVVVFMKGTPQMPQCGFSSRTAQALQA